MTSVLSPRPRGDRSFERIYRRHAADVYRYAFAVLRNQADAEDVTQTTFMNAYRAFQAGERPRQPHNWLITIAHNVCRQRFRQSQRRVQEVAYDDTVAEAFVADDEAPSADDIKRALSHLAFNQRAALVMRELEGRSYAEIAEILEVSVSAVETLIFRARRALREQLEDRLTCREAELAISRQLDGQLARGDKGPLRAHLRECDECGSLARKLRAQRAAIRSLAFVPLPPSLASLFGGAAAGGAAWGLGGLGVGVASKAVAGVAAAALVAGGSYELVREAPWRPAEDTSPRAAQSAAPEAAAAGQARAAAAVAASTPQQPRAQTAGPQPERRDATATAKDLPAAAVEARAKGQAVAAEARGSGQEVAAEAKARAASKAKLASEPRAKAKTKPKAAPAPSRRRGTTAPSARHDAPPARSPKPDRKVRIPAASFRVDMPSSVPGLSRPPAPGILPK